MSRPEGLSPHCRPLIAAQSQRGFQSRCGGKICMGGRHLVPASWAEWSRNGGSTTQQNRDWCGFLRSPAVGGHWHARAATEPDRNERNRVPAPDTEWIWNRLGAWVAYRNGRHRISASWPGRKWNHNHSTWPHGDRVNLVSASCAGGFRHAHAAAKPHWNRQHRLPASRSGGCWSWQAPRLHGDSQSRCASREKSFPVWPTK
jgi:hypothetical protein